MTEPRRVYFRINTHFPLEFALEAEPEKFFPALSTDLSSNGIGFLTEVPLTVDQQILVRFKLPRTSKAIRSVCEVRRQVKNPAENTGNYITGVLFLDLEDSEITQVAKFIARTSSFWRTRLSVLFLGWLSAALTALHLMLAWMIQCLASTPAGHFWRLRGLSGPVWIFYLALHGILILAFAVLPFRFFSFSSLARKVLVGTSLLGAAVQLARVLFKTHLLTGDLFVKGFYASELLLGLLFGAIVWLAGRKSFGLKFEAYLKSLGRHA